MEINKTFRKIEYSAVKSLSYLFHYAARFGGAGKVLLGTGYAGIFSGYLLGNISVSNINSEMPVLALASALSALIIADGFYTCKRGERPYDLAFTGLEKLFHTKSSIFPKSSELRSEAEKIKGTISQSTLSSNVLL